MLYDAVLINKPWHVLTNDRDTVYIKCHFEEKSYCLVVTDFKQVWAEEADIAVLIAKAREQDLALETNEQISMLISQLKDHLKSLEKCTFRRLQDRIDVDYTESKGFAAFSWTFQCNPIKDAAKVLYQQVFGPILAIIQSVPAAHLSFANGSILKEHIEKMVSKEKRIPPLGKEWLDRIEIAAQALETSVQPFLSKRERPLSRSVSPPSSSGKKKGQLPILKDTHDDQEQTTKEDSDKSQKRQREA
ncbi:hypothetical protein VTP01DRAFT_9829 [Rhizomucor pusillus]|uniref:uncharacterized protein n=1 Tax=Rhizomucor pusillus TaxID=4840 RepID=UPI0037444F14